ncbi:MAG TPA: DUF5681 domain-containing protein [Syntrophobacter fumaroxidans]|nr:DUF5681 domain-containing protein [Syntrophobacter fumaroxidans]
MVWVKGQSGNPRGKRPGQRNKATLAAEALINGRADQLVEKVVEMALEGDVTCLRACLDRLVPPRKDAPIRLTLPGGDLSKVTGAILKAVAAGNLTPSEGTAIAGVVEAHRKAVETVELEERIRVLEAKEMK